MKRIMAVSALVWLTCSLAAAQDIQGDRVVVPARNSSRPRLVKVETHNGGVSALIFTPDGRRLVSAGGSPQEVRIWDARSGLELLTLRGATAGVHQLTISPDGHRLATLSLLPHNEVLIWDCAPMSDGEPR